MFMSGDVEEKAEELARSAVKTVKTSVSIARDLWQQVKIEAIKRGLTFAQIVEEALRKWLELEEQERKKRTEK